MGSIFFTQKKPLNKVICKVRKRRTGTPCLFTLGMRFQKTGKKKVR